MKKYLFFLLINLCSIMASAQFRLSESATISLLTCEPLDGMAYTLYGHTAIRVNDPANGVDDVFNYGMFDFTAPYFLYRFAKGELNYELGVDSFAEFFYAYSRRKSGVTEQVLNLTTEEKQKIIDALQINYLPENRTYLYNFFFDNCSTRPRLLIEKNISGTIEYPQILPQTTFRTIVRQCNRNHRWLTFGIELALGAPLDSLITQEPQLFLPENLMLVFDRAKIKQADGSVKDLVAETHKLAPSYPTIEEPVDSNPAVTSWLFFILILLVSVWEFYKKKYFRWLDFILFFVYGLTGCVVFFLSFMSIHPTVFPNFSILWAHPLHIILAISLFIKPLKKFVNYYLLINGLILSLLILGWKIFPQEFNAAFFPLALTLCIRSLRTVIPRIFSKIADMK